MCFGILYFDLVVFLWVRLHSGVCFGSDQMSSEYFKELDEEIRVGMARAASVCCKLKSMEDVTVFERLSVLFDVFGGLNV